MADRDDSSGSNSVDCNPYEFTDSGSGTTAHGPLESFRREHLFHETSIQSIGVTHGAVGLVGLIVSLSLFSAAIQEWIAGSGKWNAPLSFVVAVLIGAFSIFQIRVARAINRLEPWSRTASTFISAMGLLLFPIGTLLGGYFLYLLRSKKGETVFSEVYRVTIRLTPDVRYRTPVYLWVVFVILLALLLFAAVGGIMSDMARNRPASGGGI